MSEAAGTWARVSSTGQDEENQIPEITTWCDNRSYDVRARYTVKGRSAFRGNKKFDEAWAQVLSDLKSGKITVLVVWKQNRLDRKLHTFQMIAQVVEAGGRVEFTTQPHLNDLSTMAGRIALKVEEELAHAESQNKSDAVRIAQDRVRGNGALWGRPAFGYTVDAAEKYSHKLIPAPTGQIIVPAVFAWCIDGLALDRIADRLTALGVPTGNKKDNKWSPGRVAAIVRCPTYKGRQCEQDPRTKRYGRMIHTCPELVDAGTWKQANDQLDGRPKRGRRGVTVSAEKALLTSALTCPGCGGPQYRLLCGKARVPWYRCAGKLAGTRQASCGVMVLCSVADELAQRFLSGLDSPVMAEVTTRGHDHAGELEKLQDELNDLPRLNLPRADEQARREELWAQQDELKALPATKTETKLEPTGQTYGQAFGALAAPARNGWIQDSRITFQAARTDSGLCEAAYAVPPVPGVEKSLLVGEGVSVVVSWPTTMNRWAMFSAQWEDSDNCMN